MTGQRRGAGKSGGGGRGNGGARGNPVEGAYITRTYSNENRSKIYQQYTKGYQTFKNRSTFDQKSLLEGSAGAFGGSGRPRPKTVAGNGVFGNHIGAVLGASWGRLGAWIAVLGRLGAVLGRLGAVLRRENELKT